MPILLIRDDIPKNWRKLCIVQWTQEQLQAFSKKAKLPGRYFSVYSIKSGRNFHFKSQYLPPSLTVLHWHPPPPHQSDSSATNKDRNEMQSKVWKSVKDATSTNTMLIQIFCKNKSSGKVTTALKQHNTTEIKFHSIDLNTNVNPHIQIHGK
jgi:hypothetical protein